jgi:DNA repair protein SbcC/Rad50
VRVLELSLRNFRVFEEVDLELPARVIGIFGPNGAGKTSLMESIAFALYGVDAARTKRDGIRTHGVLTDCEVRVVFEHAGERFEVRRAIKGRGHAPEAELYAGGLAHAAGATEVTAEIAKLLHMDLPVFRASVFAEQKQLDAFSDMRTGERKEMVRRLLGILPVDRALEQARRRMRASNDAADQLAGAVSDLAALEAEVKEANDAAREAERAAAGAERTLQRALRASKAARKAFDGIDEARERAERLTALLDAKVEQRDGMRDRERELTARVDRLTGEMEGLPDLRRELEGIGDVHARLLAARRLEGSAAKLAKTESQLGTLQVADVEDAAEALRAARDTLADGQASSAKAAAERDHRIALLGEADARLARAGDADPSHPCPTCGRPLGDDFAGYVRHCKAQVAEARRARTAADRAAKAAASALAKLDDAAASAAAAADRARSDDDRHRRLAEQADELRAEVATLSEPFQGAMPDVDELERAAERATALTARVVELGAARDHLSQLDSDLADLRGRLSQLDAELSALSEEATQLSFDPDEHVRLRAELDAADTALESARAEERAASGAAMETEKSAERHRAELAHATRTSQQVDELRTEGRYLDRTAGLLDGFRDHLVARVGPELSREAEAMFRELTNHEYDDLRVHDDTLAIEIADGDAYFPVSRFSGSESDLANLALRVAISSHLSRVSGADVGFLVLDEVLGSLDLERKDLMVQAMGRLAERFHQVFVITHAEQVKDQFPASILVQKEARRRSGAVLV